MPLCMQRKRERASIWFLHVIHREMRVSRGASLLSGNHVATHMTERFYDHQELFYAKEEKCDPSIH